MLADREKGRRAAVVGLVDTVGNSYLVTSCPQYPQASHQSKGVYSVELQKDLQLGLIDLGPIKRESEGI
jgi:hypothetical protein